MGLTLLTAPTLEPLTVSEVRAHLSIDGADHDAKITGYIIAARKWAEGYTHKALMRQTWDYTLDFNWPCVLVKGCWRTRIELPLPPHKQYLNTAVSPNVTASPVTSVSYVDSDGATQTLATSQYDVRLGGPFGYIEPAYNVTWPTVRYQPAAITVRIVCGFGSNPGDVDEDLRHAMLMHVELMFERDPTTAATIERARDSLISGNQSVRL